MRETIKVTIITILVSVGMVIGVNFILTQINIGMGPYECIDIDNNTVECEQTWRSHGVLYGITKDGRTIDLKSYESIKEE